MPRIPEAFVYLPDENDLFGAMDGWPSDVGLALLLQSDGSSTAIPFHVSHCDALLHLIAQDLDLQPHDLAVFPSQERFLSIPIRYSDEQQLLRFLTLAEPEVMLGPARDFAMNQRFVQEEGLDNIEHVGRLRIVLSDAQSSKFAEYTAMKSKPKVATLPTFRRGTNGSVKPENTDKECEVSRSKIATKHRHFPATLSRTGHRVTLSPTDAEPTGEPISIHSVQVQDDLQSFCIPLPAGADTHTIISLPFDRLPCAILPKDGQKRPAQIFDDGTTLTVALADTSGAQPASIKTKAL